ncbi:leucine-, isoleucine-, valine-, threonine-, and alanine-binding protein [Sideroxyarcus emersonii]|uniref:Leucine-, isoleucine-, valine-, threonine-, and alanine-binding protein n=1 Tax=Sideroxyarcus emersonii TaxID=2764705 RepID=A0AAN1XBW2_9PROT|nr:branched-chain amino acid ABC transporter substrate-binding protein [Sideroxyarcus emersonii]BCK88655.1 leucine-, isoleucine-, valine-, threonine-, and alanine-binding protein [Sideroxyarcus emersonii]
MFINKSALLVALGIALAGCGKSETASNPAAASPDELVIKIGAAAPLTGPQAHIGKDNENGTRMAIDDANARGVTIGGKKARFELLSEDDQTDPKTATIVAQKLVDAKVNGVIGHLNSGTTIPASAIYFKNGIPQISPSATAVRYTAQGYKTAFRVMTNDAQQGKALGEFAAKVLGAKQIAVIDDRTAYGQGLADEFVKSAEANGAKIIVREYTTDKAVDFTAVLTSIKGKQPDLLFFGGMDPQGVPMIKQLRALGIKTQFMMGDGGYTPKLIELAGDAAEGAYASLPGVPLDNMPSGRDFAKRYEERFHQPIQLYAPYCYDAVNVMIAAMQKAGSAEPEKYLPEIGKTEIEGVTAKIAFDEKGDIKGGAVTVYQVHQGKWHAVQTMGGTPAVKP